jgi:hypothetical protein
LRHGESLAIPQSQLKALFFVREFKGHGFFLRPADPRSNNLSVFVTAAGMQNVRFL